MERMDYNKIQGILNECNYEKEHLDFDKISNELNEGTKSLKEKFVGMIYNLDNSWDTFYIDEDGEMVDSVRLAKVFDDEDEAEEWAEENRPIGWGAYGSKLKEFFYYIPPRDNEDEENTVIGSLKKSDILNESQVDVAPWRRNTAERLIKEANKINPSYSFVEYDIGPKKEIKHKVFKNDDEYVGTFDVFTDEPYNSPYRYFFSHVNVGGLEFQGMNIDEFNKDFNEFIKLDKRVGHKVSKIDEATIPQAKRFAARKHGERGQIRKASGLPYIVHPEGVAALVKNAGGDDEQVQAAWLHDTMEDTGTTYDDLVEKFGKRVADIVASVTNDPYLRKENKEVYMSNKLEHLPHDALLVKLCDMKYNVSDFCPPEQKSRIKKNITHLLLSRDDLTRPEKTICDKILRED